MSNTLAVMLGDELAAAAPFYGGAPPAGRGAEDQGRDPRSTTAGSIRPCADAYPAQEAELKKNNIQYEGHIYPNSVHGFFNDATPERYNKVTAQQAWTRTHRVVQPIRTRTRRGLVA